MNPSERPDDHAPDDAPGEDHIPLEPSAPRPDRRPPPPEPRGSIAGASVTEGMGEDELEEIERDSEPRPKRPKPPAEDEIPLNALGAPGRLGWRFPLGIGVAAIVAAVVLAAVHPPANASWWRAALKQLIDAPLYAWVGVGAVLVAAQIIQRPFGAVQYVLAHMTLAVGSFALLFQLANVFVISRELDPALTWPLGAVPGALIYVGWLMFGYRLDFTDASKIGALHLFAWFILFLFRAVAA